MQITLKTLTPLWTGGVDQTCDRLHETGLIGSLRWWYEALVRGLGGYACDPTSVIAGARCQFNVDAYQLAKKNGKPEEEALQDGLKTVCPVCYLFGATGWARLFQLRAVAVQMTPLHFRTTIKKLNAGWLERIFGGSDQKIERIDVPYGKLTFHLTSRRYNEAYATGQLALVLHLAADYGGLGARLQHGFGQILFPAELNNFTFPEALQQLQSIIHQGFLRSTGPAVDTPFDLKNLVALNYELTSSDLSDFMNGTTHVGNPGKREEILYIPCAFDLRYKGRGDLGMRQWLKQKEWLESSDPDRLGDLDLLLGPRAQWGGKNSQKQIREELRTAGRIFLGMPYLQNNRYILRVWAFWPPELRHKLPEPRSLLLLIEEYMQKVFHRQPVKTFLGSDILAQGGTK